MTDPAPTDPATGPAADVRADVRAAGCVVWRRPDGTADGAAEVLLVHRPKYDDWSLPKGKLDPGEGFEAAAIREVREETGVVGELGADLGAVRYVDRAGRDKVVRWWAMQATTAGRPDSEEEVDALVWLPLAEAAVRATYDTDRSVLDRFAAAVPLT